MKSVVRRLADRRAVKWALIGLVTLVVIDGFLTNILVNHGIASEGNPFLSSVAGGSLFIIIKAVGATVCAFILYDIYRHWQKLGTVCAYLFLLIYFAIVLWNGSLLVGSFA